MFWPLNYTNKMKSQFLSLATVLMVFNGFAQSKNSVTVYILNDKRVISHLSLIAHLPTGKQETRVSNLEPGQEKTFSFPAGTSLYFIDSSLEASAMTGKDLRTMGVQPSVVLPDKGEIRIKLSSQMLLGQPDSRANRPDPNQALGTWIIDLRPDPQSEPYLKEFKFTKINGGRFDGEFYGYPFGGGFLNVNWDRIYFAFTTQDQSGTYFHSGYILGDEVFGITLNEQREFVLPWRGARSKK